MTNDTTNTPATAIDNTRLAGLLAFLQEAERLKDTLRSGTTRQNRPESTAEHSWRLCLMVLLFERELAGIDMLRLLKLCVIHDLGEAISGDVPAPFQTPDDDREARERRDFVDLCKRLPDDQKAEMLGLFEEYNAAKTPEAKLAKGFDKLETILQHHLMPSADAEFHTFNLGYGLERTNALPLTRQIREIVDQETRQIIDQRRQEKAD
ncbi:HD domain-containing protein [Roseibium sp.]|uniref:HD domain-containing protein n=1 Tax=Roseibium sp. TaxID=1936156 RepID=UPI003B52AA90